MSERQRTGLVIVASTRAAHGVYDDRSGPIAVEFLRAHGFTTPDAIVVPDAHIAHAVDSALGHNPPSVLLTSGGTGVTPDDLTVEAVTPHITKPLPGLVQDFFARGLAHTPLAITSRAVAGIAGSTVVMTLPGSTGGVKDGIATLEPVLQHLVELVELEDSDGSEAAGTATGGTGPADGTAPGGTVLHASIMSTPIEDVVDAAVAQTATEADGAVVTFHGVVRNHDAGHSVLSLDYTCHPTADAEIRRVAEEVASAYPNVRLWTAHRIGHLAIGDVAFAVVAASAHRAEAFAACSLLTDRVKAEVPIWKEQQLSDGSAQWVGLE
ncbi:molybdenum cofactor biosynthesis protein MoaB [Corynebacterium sp. zg254]|uniref:Molybdenum cofactor biosynthesis protein MoaB n=1 Tax=Corynebacterium zhongnanshanii TaxID=2768834 RepID=A0ABQ6VKZ9_9CORY|nr:MULTISPECIES: molybdenum cofactor biosynthesis protein MoaE [Corynebacterium]KAB3523126.1 molybdenum cofactor biosynthesis protein MoaB [Corynebacterium zhongnanshanii]MCR5913770.1 molybdenum cofactor biosynthesis protein MoaB [Corynebacterium sp. zg254]